MTKKELPLKVEYREGKPIFTLSGDFYFNVGVWDLRNTPSWEWNVIKSMGEELKIDDPLQIISNDLGIISNLMYRGTSIDKLEELLNTGTDRIGKGLGSKTFASPYFEKAREYGYGAMMIGGQDLDKKICIALYDGNGMRGVDAGNSEGRGYFFEFTKDPREVLKGILVLDPKR